MVAQVFVRVLDGTTRCLAFDDAASLREGIAVAALARRLEASEGVPARGRPISASRAANARPRFDGESRRAREKKGTDVART